MSLIRDKSLEAINAEDLQRLVDDEVLEDKEIEYKSSLPNFDIITDKKEFLADVSSFANASGGDLIYGIKEDRGVPSDLCGCLDKTEIDRLKRRIESIIHSRSNIDPRISGISIQPIELENGRFVIIVRIPRSWASPHMVTFELKDHDRFFSRRSGGKYALDVSEIRTAFALSETRAEQIRNFRIDRIGKIISEETPISLNKKVYIH